MSQFALPYRAVRVRLSPLVPSLLRRPQRFRLLFASHTVSLLGDEVSVIAIPLVAVIVLHAGPGEMGLLMAAGGAPTLLFSLHVGSWLDRSGCTRGSMLAADLGRALLTISIPLAWELNALTATQLFVVAFLAGTLGLVSSVSHSTVFVSLVPRSLYLEANSLLQGARGLSRAVGAGLGGLLVQLLSAPLAVLVDAISFLLSAIFLTQLRRRQSVSAVSPGVGSGPPEEQAATRQSVSAGLAWIARDRVIRPMLTAVAINNFFLFGFYTLFVLYATRVLRIPPQLLGVVLGGAAVGALAGSAATSSIRDRIGIGPAFTIGCVLFPAPLIAVAGIPPHGYYVLSVGALFAAQLVSGFGLMMLDVTGGTLRVELIPDDMRARVAGAYMLVNKGVRPLGALVGGLAGGAIGMRLTLAITTIGATSAVLWLVGSPLRRLGAPSGRLEASCAVEPIRKELTSEECGQALGAGAGRGSSSARPGRARTSRGGLPA
jgi:predicted MFS family arabinose efflux permease